MLDNIGRQHFTPLFFLYLIKIGQQKKSPYRSYTGLLDKKNTVRDGQQMVFR